MNAKSNDLKRIATLPKWAQQWIAILINKANSAEHRLSAYQDSQTKSQVYYQEWGCARRYIQHDRVRFEIRPDVVIEVILVGDGKLHVRSITDILVIQPNASNSVSIDTPSVS